MCAHAYKLRLCTYINARRWRDGVDYFLNSVLNALTACYSASIEIRRLISIIKILENKPWQK